MSSALRSTASWRLWPTTCCSRVSWLDNKKLTLPLSIGGRRLMFAARSLPCALFAPQPLPPRAFLPSPPAQACPRPLTCCLPILCDFFATAGASSWAIRSKASLLLALVIKRTGPELWEAALPQLLQAAQTEGPPMQEQVGVGELLRYVAGLLGGCKAQVALQAAVWSIAGCDEQSLLPSKAVIAGQHCPWGCHPACHLPVQVCMVMRYVADEIAMYSDDIAVRTCC